MKKTRMSPPEREADTEAAPPPEASPESQGLDSGAEPSGEELAETESTADAAAGEEAVYEATPMGAEEFTPDTMDTLAAVLPPAIERLTDGHITANEVQIPPDAAGLDRLPPAAAKHILAVSEMVRAFGPSIKGLERYTIDPAQLSTNKGAVEAALVVDRLSRDAKMVAAIAAGPTPQQQPAAEPTAAPEVA